MADAFCAGSLHSTSSARLILVPVARSGAPADAGRDSGPPAPVGLPAPDDVAAPPADAIKTASGISILPAIKETEYLKGYIYELAR